MLIIKFMRIGSRLEKILRSFNLEQGKVIIGGGTSYVMFIFIVLFAIFLLILLQICNSTLIINNSAIGWNFETNM